MHLSLQYSHFRSWINKCNFKEKLLIEILSVLWYKLKFEDKFFGIAKKQKLTVKHLTVGYWNITSEKVSLFPRATCRKLTFKKVNNTQWHAFILTYKIWGWPVVMERRNISSHPLRTQTLQDSVLPSQWWNLPLNLSQRKADKMHTCQCMLQISAKALSANGSSWRISLFW